MNMKIKILFSVILISVILPVFVIGQENFDLPNPGLTPNSPFYFLDTTWKKVNLFFTFSPEKKAGKAFQFAEERLAEANVMAEKNKTKALASANQGYQEFLGLANQKTKEAKEQGKDVEELAVLITEKTLKHQEILAGVFEKVPEEAKTAIQNAIEISRKGSETAVEAVSGTKKEELLQKIDEMKTTVDVKISALEGRIKSLEEKLEERATQAESEIERLKRDAEIAKEETERAKLLVEVERAKLEAEKARAEAEKAKAEAGRLKKEMEEAKKQVVVEETVVQLSITGVSPNQILSNIENPITISGFGVQKGAEVIIGNISFGSGNFIDSKTLVIKIYSGVLSPGVYNVQIKNPDGETDILNNALTVVKPQPPASTELTTAEIVAKVSSAVIQIKNDIKQSTGSGVIIDLTGYILTNEHVIQGDSAVEINYNGQIFYNVPVIGWNAIKDLAVIKLAGNNFSYINLGNSDTMVLGQNVVALGYPLSNFPSSITALDGIISNRNVIDNSGTTYLQTSANVQHGSSGGPLVDMNANVVGINSQCPDIDIFSGLCPAGFALAIKINEAKSILPDLKAGAKVSLPTPTPEPTPTPTPQPSIPTDAISPEISNIQISNIAPSPATISYSITWTTNEPGTSQVWYGPTESLGNLTSLNSNLILSHAVTLYGLSPEATYYLKVISKDASGNQTVSSIQGFYTSAITPGTLTIATASSPGDQSVVSGTTNVPIVGLVMAAGSVENVRVVYLKLTRNSSGVGVDSDISNIALWDGGTRITIQKNLSNGYVSFSASDFLNSSGIDITKSSQKTITVKADISSAAPVGNLNSLGIVSANDITFAGLDSNQTPSPTLSGGPGSCTGINTSCSSPSDAHEVLISRPMPTLASSALTSTNYGSGGKSLYRWTVTAGSKGDIGWKKVVFDMSGSVTFNGSLNTVGCVTNCTGLLSDGVYMSTGTDVATQLIAISSMKLYNRTTGVQLTTTTWKVNNGNGVAKIEFVPDSEQVVAAGETVTYELLGTILKSGATGDILQTKIVDGSTNLITDTYINLANTRATLVWTDRSAENHSESTADWFNDYGVRGIPTATLSLSR